MKKILLLNFYSFINSSGGAERICCNMANKLIMNNYYVKIVCNDDLEGMPFYELSKEVELANIALRNIRVPIYRKILRELLKPFFKMGALNYYDEYKNIVRAKKLEKIITVYKPDIIICNDLESASALYYCKHVAKTIFMLHGNGEGFYKILKKYSQYVNIIEKFDIIQVLLPSYKELLEKIISNKIICIANPVPMYNKILKSDKFNIVHVGRIAEEKGQLKLIKAFASICSEFSQWKILMYGKVYQENYAKEIRKYIENNNLQKQVLFMGEATDIKKVWDKAEILVLPSVAEGFPLALTEAMSAGLAVIGLENCGGVNELIKDRKNGVLVKDSLEDLADGMECLMEDSELRIRIGMQASKDMQKYNEQSIWSQWEKLIEDLLQSSNR